MLTSATALLAFALVMLGAEQPLLLAAALGVAAFAAATVVALVVVARLARAGAPVPRAAVRGLSVAQPAPSHPDTDGRARPRAPGRMLPAA
jgi:hypothetical protein